MFVGVSVGVNVFVGGGVFVKKKKIELSSQPTINAIAVLRATSCSNIAGKQLSKGTLPHHSGHGLDR